jgi:hypothetical protein
MPLRTEQTGATQVELVNLSFSATIKRKFSASVPEVCPSYEGRFYWSLLHGLVFECIDRCCGVSVPAEGFSWS